MNPHAVVLLAHGSRDPAWSLPIEAMAIQVREALQAKAAEQPQVLCAYLEWSAPLLEEALANLAQQGTVSVRLLPLFWGEGYHAKQDTPQRLQACQKQYPNMQLTLLNTLCQDPIVIARIAQLAAETYTDEEI